MIKIKREKVLLLTFCIFSLAISLASAAYPSARWGSATWYYDNKFWLYGGSGYADGSAVGKFGFTKFKNVRQLIKISVIEGYLSDLWSYDPMTNQWRFEMGYRTAGQPSVAGYAGSYSAQNTPGARQNACSWVANNTLWLFGGINAGLGKRNPKSFLFSNKLTFDSFY